MGAVEVAAAEVWLSKLRIAVLPEPTPTAGTDPTSFPVAVPLLPLKLADVLPESVTILGSAAVDDAASCTVSDADEEAPCTVGAVAAWRRRGLKTIGFRESSTT